MHFFLETRTVCNKSLFVLIDLSRDLFYLMMVSLSLLFIVFGDLNEAFAV